MGLFLTLLALVCFLVSFMRVLRLLERLDWRNPSTSYWRFLALGAGEAALCMLCGGGAIAIAEGGADGWVYLLVLSTGLVALGDLDAK